MNTFQGLAESFSLDLRVQEQCFARLAVTVMTVERGKLHLPLVTGLLCLQAANPTLYNDFVNEVSTVDLVLKFIEGNTRGRKFLNDEEAGILFEVFLLKSRVSSDPSVGRILDGYKVATSAADKNQQRVLRADAILQRVFSEIGNYDMVKEAAQAIDFSGRFFPPAAP